MDDVLAFIDQERKRYVDELVAWCRIPSISSDSRNAADVVKNAEHLAADFKRLGAAKVAIWPTGVTADPSSPSGTRATGHPAVFGEWMHAPGRPTLLIYGHHDVQPVD